MGNALRKEAENWTFCGTFFSVSFDLIVTEFNAPFDLYANSSIVAGRERYIKVYRAYDYLEKTDVDTFRMKYSRLYIKEDQREVFLQTIMKKMGRNPKDKVSFLKDSAISYLERLFDKEKIITTDFLRDNLSKVRDVVSNIVDVINDYNVDQLKDLIGQLSFHDFYTYDHSINVSMYCIVLFKAICPLATKNEIITAGMGGMFHDLGKIRIPTEILNGTGALTEEKFNIIKKHPQDGYELLRETKMDYTLGVDPLLVARVVLEHHENFNGTGYPNKTAYDEIHLLARICAVADFFDAVTTKRSYQEAMPVSEALALMSRYSGTKLDPMVFSIFLEQTDNFIREKVSKTIIGQHFDPCKPNNTEDCLCTATVVEAKEHYGRVIYLDKKEIKTFKDWAQNPIVKYYRNRKSENRSG